MSISIDECIEKEKKFGVNFVFGYKKRKALGVLLAYVVLIVCALIVVLPLFWIFLTSLKNRVLAYQMPPAWFFTPTLENYQALFVKYPFTEYFFNSAIIAICTTLIALLLGTLAAYSISRFNTGGNQLRLWVLNSYTMPPVALMIPIFMLASSLKMLNTYPMIILTYLSFLLPFTIWMLIGFFDGVAKDMEEAAMVDGATQLQALWYVTIPMAAPGIAAAGIISFLFSWNEFIFALVLTGNKTRTLPVAVSNFLTQRGVLMGELSAASMLMIIPFIFLGFSVRNHLIKGLSLGAIK